jgi:CheY-like chemotaxis protein
MSYVLVIEDDPLGAATARDFLASLGHRVSVVPTLIAATRSMAWVRPDVVLADRCLPRGNDRELQAACNRLAVPLIDLATAICLMGRQEHIAEHASSELSSTAG